LARFSSNQVPEARRTPESGEALTATAGRSHSNSSISSSATLPPLEQQNRAQAIGKVRIAGQTDFPWYSSGVSHIRMWLR